MTALSQKEECEADWAMHAIALGSNLGDSRAILEAALVTLAATPEIKLQVNPAGIKPQLLDHRNQIILTAVLLHVQTPPQMLLETLLKIEAQFGRVRREGARSLDLDLLLYDDLILDTPTLQLPHPRMKEQHLSSYL